jgi:hypothetical protein
MWLALLLTLPLADGKIDFDFLSPSTFKFIRTWGASPGPAQNQELKSEHLIVRISSTGQLTVLAVSTGKVLLSEAAPARRIDGEIVLSRHSLATEEFFGLGPRTDARLGARGREIASQSPFLISTAGYALDHKNYGRYRFDLAASNKALARISIAGADRLEYLFHYGPSPKEIYDERFKIGGSIDYSPSDVELLSTRNVPRYARKMDKQADPCSLVHSLVHAALSGATVPAVNLDHYPASEAFAAGLPMVYRDQPMANPAWRERLRIFLVTYLQEVRDRGYPMIHPLPFQYPTEVEARERADEYLLGDELLVAPLCGQSKRTVYLPRGNWTDIHTGITHKGRQTIDVTGDETKPIFFLRNGAILPLAEGETMQLHYTPKLGAEFFLWESDLEDISQVHAGPSAEFLRLEIESKLDRKYEWIVFLGEGKTLRRTVDSKAGGNEIVNLPLPW